MDSTYKIKCELRGFKNKEKSYRLKIVSNDLMIIGRDTSDNSYTFKLLKDTVKVDCFLEGHEKPFIYWMNYPDERKDEFIFVNSDWNIGSTFLKIKK